MHVSQYIFLLAAAELPHTLALVTQRSSRTTFSDAALLVKRAYSASAQCGKQNGGTACNPSLGYGNCCSSSGWCGSTSAYCGTGCQSGCTTTNPTAPRADGRCGSAFGGATCDPKGSFGGCCSSAGYCGSTTAYCLKSNGCQNGCTGTTTTSITSLKTSTTTAKSATTSKPSTTSTTTKPATTSSTTTSKPSTTSSSTTTTKSTTTSASSTTTTASSTSTTSTTTTTSSSASAVPTINSGKRGLSFNDATLTQPYSLSGQDSKVSWAYNWASAPNYVYVPGGTPPPPSAAGLNPALHYVPLLWSDASDLTSIWNNNVAYARANLRTDALLAFNEPDNCDGQACMSVARAVTAYKAYLQPYAGSLSLGAPAVTNGHGSGIGLDWLQQFMTACTGCTIDFIPLHFYGSYADPGQMTNYITQAHNMFPNVPIWVTEYGTTSGSQDQILTWMKSIVPWLDSQSYIQRHAYFMDAVSDTWLLNSDKTFNNLGKYFNAGT